MHRFRLACRGPRTLQLVNLLLGELLHGPAAEHRD